MGENLISTTCGHFVKSIDDLYDLQVKGYDEHMNRTIHYGCYCKACADMLDSTSQIIHNMDELKTWLNTTNLNEQEGLILDMAKSMLSYKNKNVVNFANIVIDYLNAKDVNQKHYVIKINTNTDFTLTIGEVSITGIGKLETNGKKDAIDALRNSSITWVKPVKSHMPGNAIIVREDDFHLCKFFVEYCIEAAKRIEDGETAFIIGHDNYVLEVSEK